MSCDVQDLGVQFPDRTESPNVPDVSDANDTSYHNFEWPSHAVEMALEVIRS